MAFQDHFSATSPDYARYRPTYPGELFDHLASLCRRTELAWDCGAGSGQAAVALAERFARVVATDPSARQMAQAPGRSNIEYRVTEAEAAGLAPDSVDLVTVAQALHWFDADAFHAEVKRVLGPGGLLAVWCYNLMQLRGAAGAVVRRFHDMLEPYWPPERRLVEEKYRTLAFPYREMDAPGFSMQVRWSLPHLTGYLGTWSSARAYRQQCGRDPVAEIRDELAAAWGHPETEKAIHWDLHLRIGTVAEETRSS